MDARKHSPEVRERADSELASRSIQGLWGNPLTAILTALTTTLPKEHPAVFFAFAGLTAAIAGSRLLLLCVRKRLRPEARSFWRTLMFSNVMLSAASWGSIAAFTLRNYSPGHPNVTSILLYLTAIAGAGVPLMVERVSLALLYTSLILVLPAVVCFGNGGISRYFALSMVYYFFYLAGQSRRSTRWFWIGIEDNLELARLAHHDALTGLANRLALERSVKRALHDAGPNHCVCLLYIDLNGFKEVNDRFSHRIGDLLLIEIAARLRASAEAGATVCRLGGDEFCLFLAGPLTEDEVNRTAHRILAALCRPARIDGIDIAPSASIGISFNPASASDLKDLLRTADQAMYLAKAVKGGGVRTIVDLTLA